MNKSITNVSKNRSFEQEPAVKYLPTVDINIQTYHERKLDNTNKYNLDYLNNTQLKVITLNTNSLYKNMEYINSLLDEYDIINIQETMILKEDNYKNYIYNNKNTHHMYVIEAIINNKGRPSGGMCSFVRKGIPHIYSAHGLNKMVIKIRGTALIFAYLPNEGRGHYEFKKEANDLDFVLENTISKEMQPYVIGDINVDFSRKRSKNVKCFTNLMKKFKLLPFDMVFEKGYKVTRYKGEEQSWLDHVISHENNNNIKMVRIIDDEITKVKNTSDHHPIEMRIAIKYDMHHSNNRKIIKKDQNLDKYICRWNMNKFKIEFSQEINKFDDEIDKVNQRLINATTKEENQEQLNTTYDFIHKLLNGGAKKASEKINKLVKDKKIKIEKWWSNDLKMLNSESRKYLSRYRNKGNSDDQMLSNLYQKKFRALHRLELQKHENNNVIKLERLKERDINSFWKCLKKKLQKKIKVQLEINELKDEFSKIFNDKLIRGDDTEFIIKIEDFNKLYTNKIFEYELNEAIISGIIKDLNNNKAIGINKCSNEMFKNANNVNLIKLLTNFFKKSISYGILPPNFNISIIKPLIKDARKRSNDQNNIRPISISDTFCTIFEKLLLLDIGQMHCNNKKQFGFKENSSCQHALFALNEALNSNYRAKNKTYVCAIDASKAFDKVNRNKLWCKLMTKIEPQIVRILMVYYSDSQAIVINEEDVSDIFKTTIGVKQGGCLSPRLFTIYVEDVIEQIENLNVGIKIGEMKLDILLYADDMLLLSDNILDMKRMLKVLTKYGLENEIKFNGSKTTLMSYNKTLGNNTRLARDIAKETKLELANEPVELTKHMKYLGVYYSDNYSLCKHWDTKVSNVASKISLLQQAGLHNQNLTSKTKAFLFNVYIRPLIQYGVDTFTLGKNDLAKVCEMEGNCLKDALGLFRRIHSTELFLALNLKTTFCCIKRNKLNLFRRLINNEYTKEIISNVLIESEQNVVENSLLNDINDMIGIHKNEMLDTHAINQKIDRELMQLNNEPQNKSDIVVELRHELNQLRINRAKIENLLQAYEVAEDNYEIENIFTETNQ